MTGSNWAGQGADTVGDTEIWLPESYPHPPFSLAFFYSRGWEANIGFPDSLACGTVLTKQIVRSL